MNAQTRIELSQVNEVQLMYRTKCSGERPFISTSLAAYELLREYFEPCMELHEEFWLLMLDQGSRAKAVMKVSQGGVAGTVADPRIIFCAALKVLACGLILAHNHPSGQLRPSEEDIRLTRKLADGARLLDIRVQDHVILSRHGYYSFADSGLL